MRRLQTLKLISLFFFLNASMVGASIAHAAPPPQETTLPAHLISVPTASDYYMPYVFVVDKSARTLEIWKSEAGTDGKHHFVKSASYPADLGKNSGDKVSEGDHKTPEGVYFLLDKLEGATLDFKLYGSRAYTTDYPNHFDAIDGKTGGGIWLHSVPDEVPLTRGSRGCVVVRNNIVKTLDPFIRLGRTPIVISEKIETRPATMADAASTQLEDWLQNWRKAWESKSIDNYMTYYDESFKSMNMTKAEWRVYKDRLNSQYKEISVRLSQPLALEHRGRAVVRFIQGYTSDKLSDVGEKTMHLIKRDGQWKILAENWRIDTSAPARAAITLETKTAAGL